MSNTIPFIKPKQLDPRCSFCDALKSESKHFFESGNGKYICGYCVVQGKKRLEESA